MRKLIFAAVMSFWMVASASASPSQPRAAETIVSLYKAYAWEAVIEQPDESSAGLFQQPRSTLEKYFSTHLAALILRDRQCQVRTGEVCRLDFSPIWASQDPQATELEVIPTRNPSVVSVQFHYPGTNKTIKLIYTLSKTANGWRISDIQSQSWSLEKILSAAQ